MRNPYLVALVVIGCILTLTALVLLYGLAEDVLGYPQYDVTEVVVVSIWTTVTGVGAVIAFVGALVVAGVSWRSRSSVTPSRGSERAGRAEADSFTNS